MTKKDFLRSTTIMILFNIFMILDRFFTLDMKVARWVFFSLVIFFFLAPLKFLDKYKDQKLSFFVSSFYYLLILLLTISVIVVLSPN